MCLHEISIYICNMRSMIPRKGRRLRPRQIPMIPTAGVPAPLALLNWCIDPVTSIAPDSFILPADDAIGYFNRLLARRHTKIDSGLQEHFLNLCGGDRHC